MTRWDDAAFDAYLPSDMVLGEAEVGVIVADRLSNLLYLNRHAARLLGLGSDAVRFAGQPLHALGFISSDDLPKAADMSRQVLHGRAWEGTFAGLRSMKREGGVTFIRTLAVPLRHAGGDIDGMVLLATEAGRRDADSGQDRIGLLERIGERLAGSLELDATLRHVAEVVVPKLADHCFIDLFHGEQLIRRVHMHAGNWEPPPGTWARVGDEVHYPEGHFCQQAMSRLETIVVPDLNARYYPAPSHASMVAADDAGLTSVIAAPLYARGELLGVMSLALSRLTSRDDPHYDMSDRDLFGAIASRVAVAIDNAMLFETERRTALAFQQSLLPQAVPELDGLDVAFRYVPAKPLKTQGQGIQTQVGGDWYDIIPLAAGRVGVVIGDVEGRGARAAATMGQLRAALRAFAQDEKAPADILRKLDEWVRTISPPSMSAEATDPPTVSCIYMVYDAWSRELTFAVAGHDAPLLVSGDSVEPIEIRHKGVLLGVRGRGIRGLPTYTEQTIVVPPGATLVLYTDGLTDRRTRVDGSGHYTEAEAVAMLREAVRVAAVRRDGEAGGGAAAADGAAGGAARVVAAAEHAVPGDIDDDMAILAFRTAEDELPSAERVFPAEPIMVSEARRLAAQTFLDWNMDPDQSELACLLVSEVVTNAVLHAAVTPHPSRRYSFDMPATLALPAGTGPMPVMSFGSAGVTGLGLPGYVEPPVPRRATEFVLRLRKGESAVWVEVFDPDLRLPRLRTAAATDEGGRGLYLVEQLATRWGSRPTPEGKAVWFEMPLHG
jgi:serine phosphatase RsbU (regulator of sigma subunit)/anti-sigma regulatory factor (Ser/Thr protein kinase)